MPEPGRPTPNEVAKEKSLYLRGTIAEELAKDTTHFGKEDNILLKSHGTYEQDDRDLRQKLLAEKKEPAYGMMARLRTTGGKLFPEQYIQFDEIADQFGNHTLRATTRQTFQFYSIKKVNLKKFMQAVHKAQSSTQGACGDNVRNVLYCPAPFHDRAKYGIFEYAVKVSNHFLAKGGAYEEIWLDGERIKGVETKSPEEVEPIYGKTFLPRKFKIAFAFPDDNCVDVYSNDLGIVPEIKDEKLLGFTILAGGGFGTTHGVKTTYPRLGSPLCFVKPEDLVKIAEAVVLTQRDFGNREDRKTARLKYTIDRMGLAKFREEVEKRFGKKTEDPRPLKWDGIYNHLGWHEEGNGKWFLGLPIQNGRIKDEGSFRMKSGFRALVEKYRPMIYVTAQQDILFSGFSENQKKEVEAFLTSYGIPLQEQFSNIRKDSMACVALPTCGLAIAESERVFPDVIGELEKHIADLGLSGQRIMARMTGCPNGCARPYNAEISFIGRSVGTYNIYVGGSLIGDRLNVLYAEKVPLKDLSSTLLPLLKLYKKEKRGNEGFGDFCHRAGLEHLKTASAGL